MVGVTLDTPDIVAAMKALESLPDKVRNKLIRQTLRAATKTVRDAVVAETPVLTGALKSNIKVRAGKRSRVFIRYHVQLPERLALGIDAKSEWYYPAIIEYGSAKRNIAPRRFVRDTTEKMRATATAQIAKGIRDAVLAEAKR